MYAYHSEEQPDRHSSASEDQFDSQEVLDDWMMTL